ncbi:MAG: hypothetical protein NXI31_03910 [bacterium]|nr:hypothetical protein [bacterium]
MNQSELPPRALARRTIATLLALAGLTLAPTVAGQCTTTWTAGNQLPGTDRAVLATASWDPDGNGPRPAGVVVAGGFAAAGSVQASGIAFYDPSRREFAAIGPPGSTNGVITNLLVMPNNDLVAAGTFLQIAGVPAARIARFDGTSWQALGNGMDDQVAALTLLPNGDLLAGGRFRRAGNNPVNFLASWDGTSWSSFGQGANNLVTALHTRANGSIIAGGDFTQIDGVQANRVARWNRTTWLPLGNGITQPNPMTGVLSIQAIAALPAGRVAVGGTFDARGLAIWTGTGWLQPPPTSAVGDEVTCLRAEANGDLLVGGARSHIARWDGQSWTDLGPGHAAYGATFGIERLPGGDLLIAGAYQDPQTRTLSTVLRGGPGQWGPAGTGFDGAVTAIVEGNEQLVYATGNFRMQGGTFVNHIARRSAGGWLPLGPGLERPANALAVLPSGDLIAAGNLLAGPGTLGPVRRWDGFQWSSIPGLTGSVEDLLVLPDGSLLAAGAIYRTGATSYQNILRWHNNSWTPLAQHVDDTVHAVLVRPSGDVVIGGRFFAVNHRLRENIARWDGTAWHALDTGLNGPVRALANLPNGDLVAAGVFHQAGNTTVRNVARWNGTTWSAMGASFNGPVNDLVELPDGNLIATGNFTHVGNQPMRGIARWSGSGWNPVAGGLDGTPHCVAMLPRTGTLAVGGEFLRAGGMLSPRFAELQSSCSARSTTAGNGCAGTGGLNQLDVIDLAWIGGTARSRATGLAGTANDLALEVWGFSPRNVALSTVHPLAGAGCTQLVAADVMLLHLAPQRRLDTELAIPPALGLVGVALHQQVVPIEIDATNQATALTATNRLTVTIGAF